MSNTTIANLRHLYQQLMAGTVVDVAGARRIAQGLLAPAIEALERGAQPAASPAPVLAREPVAPFDLTGLRSAAYSANVALLNIIEKGLHGVAHRFSAAGNEEGLRGCQSCAAVVRDIRRTAIAAPTNLSPEMPDQQRQDLLVASFCIASVGDPSATIKPEDAERIITLLHELGGITSKEGGPSAE